MTDTYNVSGLPQFLDDLFGRHVLIGDGFEINVVDMVIAAHLHHEPGRAIMGVENVDAFTGRNVRKGDEELCRRPQIEDNEGFGRDE